jgi:hypothetical protein
MTRFIDEDDNSDMIDGILQPGGHLRVPMFLRDGVTISPVLNASQRAIVAMQQRDAQPTRMTVVDALGRSDQFHLSRPGARYAVYDTSSTEHAVHATHRAMRDEAYAAVRAETSNAWKKGTSREIATSLDSATTDARENAYQDYQNFISNAWRAGR